MAAGRQDDEAIELAFSKKKIEERKAWLAGFLPGTYLDQSVDQISYSDFVNKARAHLILSGYILSAGGHCFHMTTVHLSTSLRPSNTVLLIKLEPADVAWAVSEGNKLLALKDSSDVSDAPVGRVRGFSASRY